MSDTLCDWLVGRSTAYSFFRGRVAGTTAMFRKDWINGDRLCTLLDEADAELVAALDANDRRHPVSSAPSAGPS